MANYWASREAKQRERIFNQASGAAKQELANEYIRCLNSTKQDMEALFDEILAASADGTLLASDLYKYNRYYDLMNTLNAALQRLGGAEIKITETHLLDMYSVTSAAVGASMRFDTGYDANTAEAAVNAIWCSDGKHWKDRIWSNKAALQERIQKGLIDCVSRGSSKEDLVKQLMKDFNVGFSQADRIARTELTYVQNKATYDKYAAAGVEKYKYLATDDDRTSEKCAAMNGKVFLLKDAKVGVNYPPLHPNCRCTVLAVIEGGN